MSKPIDLQALIQPYLGLQVWDASQSVGSFISIKMGSKHDTGYTIRGDPYFRAEFSLLVQLAKWSLKVHGVEVLHSESPRADQEREIL